VELETFLNGDYQLKVRYLTDHLQRTWTRFNFFITIESALLTGLVFTRDGGGFTDAALYFLAGEAAVSVVWWVFGAQDRHHVTAYRIEIGQAWEALVATPSLAGKLPEEYSHAGHMAERSGWVSPVEWRWKWISTTKLPALVPLVLLVMWLVLIAVYAATH
jgi:hypothetical protein